MRRQAERRPPNHTEPGKRRSRWWVVVAFAVLAPALAQAARITATVTDEAGKPLPDAVVTIVAGPGRPIPIPALGSSRIAVATIDQKAETFVPSVVVIRTGGSVTFRNSDQIRHHVYSFADIHPFEMVQGPGESSQPMLFDKPGAAAIGCNIHDHMTAYVLVTDAPWAMVTDGSGTAVISDLPAGNFVATVWHPRIRPKAEPPTVAFTLDTGDSNVAISLSVLPPRRPRAHNY